MKPTLGILASGLLEINPVKYDSRVEGPDRPYCSTVDTKIRLRICKELNINFSKYFR
jgi:hypothetical protein